MQLQPIVYVTDMHRSIDWYATLLGVAPAQASDHWTTFSLGDATLALHLADDQSGPGSVELSLVATGSLEEVSSRTSRSSAIDEQPFGRSFIAVDPDGTRIQVNEHH